MPDPYVNASDGSIPFLPGAATIGIESVALPVNGSVCTDFKLARLRLADAIPEEEPALDAAIDKEAVLNEVVLELEELPDLLAAVVSLALLVVVLFEG